MTQQHEKECNFCGNAFTAKRSDAKYCSDKCRVYAKRARKKPNPVLKPAALPPSQDEMPDVDKLREDFINASVWVENEADYPNEWIERVVIYWLCQTSYAMFPGNYTFDTDKTLFGHIKGVIDTVANNIFGSKDESGNRRDPTQDEIESCTVWVLRTLMDFFAQDIFVTNFAPPTVTFKDLNSDKLQEWHSLQVTE